VKWEHSSYCLVVFVSDEIAVQVRGLGKKYTIGGPQEKYHTIRDAIANSVKAPFRRLSRRQGADKSQNEFWALKDVSFDVYEGEVIGIIGRNGAGKSTLLKILSQITTPTEGEVDIFGRVGSLLEVGTGFHPELTGRENIFLSGSILGMRKREIENKLDDIVKFSEIEKFLDTPVKRYSSGMYVRLAFAVAAHLEPEILVVDEVLAVGDVAFQKKCLGKMETVAKEGRTVLFVSHNMAAIDALCSRCILIQGGMLNQIGSSNEIVKNYVKELYCQHKNIPLKERFDRQGSGEIRVENVHFGTPDDAKCGIWITGKDALIEIDYRSKEGKTYRNIEIAIGIKKIDQTPLLYLGTKVTHQDLESFHDSGSSICKIIRLPLEPGRYSITLEIKQNGIIVDYISSAASIDVAEGDYYGTGVIWPYGAFLCDYTWKHRELT